MSNKLPPTVRDCAHPITKDIDPEGHIDAPAIDTHVAKCVAAVSEALKSPSSSLTDFQRSHFALLFHAMKWTHASIRDLLRHETKKPMSIDAMPLVRTQLESLYAICLIVEDPTYLSVYLKDSWKKLYKRFLLQREECRHLPRFTEYLNVRALPNLNAMAALAGVSKDEITTIDCDELGQIPVAGFVPKRIPQFPTPKVVIRLIKEMNRNRMLMRLYPEYQFLCSFVHVSPHPSMFKVMLDDRAPFGNLFTSSQVEHMFQNEIAGQALYIDLISVAQGCAEVLTLYRADLDLLKTVEEAWKLVCDHSLLGQIVWEMRTRGVLGVIE
jgi:hypothetical protein